MKREWESELPRLDGAVWNVTDSMKKTWESESKMRNLESQKASSWGT